MAQESEQRIPLRKIVSGGQTGVDRSALDAAMELGILCRGWCPKGRRAEDGRIPSRYPLEETDSLGYRRRTEQNVVDSDATLVLCEGKISGGTALTVRLARKHGRPCLVVDLADEPDPGSVLEWLKGHKVCTLNVAGPRESKHPGIQQRGREFLVSVLRAWRSSCEAADRHDEAG